MQNQGWGPPGLGDPTIEFEANSTEEKKRNTLTRFKWHAFLIKANAAFVRQENEKIAN